MKWGEVGWGSTGFLSCQEEAEAGEGTSQLKITGYSSLKDGFVHLR